MRNATYESFGRFLEQPSLVEQPSREKATLRNPRFEFRLMGKDALGYPDKADLEAVVCLSHNAPRIRRANLDTLPPDLRRALYTEWFLGNPYTFGLLERFPADENGNTIIGNTAILPLRRNTIQRVADGALPVISLTDTDLCTKDDYEVLLLDTWVLHTDHQGKSSWLGKHKETHRGFGNGLVLRHVAEYWTPSSGKPLKLYAEADTVSMRSTLIRLGFREIGVTQIKMPFLVLNYPPEEPRTLNNVLQQQSLHEAVRSLEAWREWCPITTPEATSSSTP